MAAEKKTSPNVESRLRHNILKMPQEVYAASGIVINGRRLKSFVSVSYTHLTLPTT